MENYNATETAIRNEAKAVGNLTQLSYALPEQEGSPIRASLFDYVKEVRHTEWGTMALGLPSKATAHALANLTQAIFDLHADQLKDHAYGSVPPILWFVLIAGALITLPAFFGTSNLVAQALMTAALAAVVVLALVPTLVLDFPFTGQVALTSDAFDEALQRMRPHLKGHPPLGTELQ